MTRQVRVLVVEKDASTLQILVEGLSADPLISVIGASCDSEDARHKVILLHPDVVVFGDNSDEMEASRFLAALMPHVPTPVVVFGSQAHRGAAPISRALKAGAIDYIIASGSPSPETWRTSLSQLCKRTKDAADIDVSHWKQKVSQLQHQTPTWTSHKPPPRLIAMGASTGGTDAIKVVLKGLRATTPGILIVQHMPSNFTRMYAQRLDDECPQRCVEAHDFQEILPGWVYIAPGGQHMTVENITGVDVIRCRPGPRVGGHCPAVNVLFRSVAKVTGDEAIGVLLTGMGRDGAEGLLEMRHAGASTIAQDEDSCVVFGMPQEAYAIGAVERIAALEDIPGIIMRHIHRAQPRCETQ